MFKYAFELEIAISLRTVGGDSIPRENPGSSSILSSISGETFSKLSDGNPSLSDLHTLSCGRTAVRMLGNVPR